MEYADNNLTISSVGSCHDFIAWDCHSNSIHHLTIWPWQVIDSSQINSQVLAALQPLTIQGGKFVAMAPAGGDNSPQILSLTSLSNPAGSGGVSMSIYISSAVCGKYVMWLTILSACSPTKEREGCDLDSPKIQWWYWVGSGRGQLSEIMI